MSSTNPVWKRFINPPFGRPLGPARTNMTIHKFLSGAAYWTYDYWNALPSESETKAEQTGTPQLDFQDEWFYADALLILLQIVHHRFLNVPANISFQTLYNLAVLIDRFDCVELVHPWYFRWLGPHRSEAHLGLIDSRWLFISWNFGVPEISKEVAPKLAINTILLGRRPAVLDFNGHSVYLEERCPPLMLGKNNLSCKNLLTAFLTSFSRTNPRMPPSENPGTSLNPLRQSSRIARYFARRSP